MSRFFNKDQQRLLSDFFSNIAAAYFIGLFVVPKLTSDFDALTVIKYVVNMIGMLVVALWLLNKKQ
jgi:hypothetical protein